LLKIINQNPQLTSNRNAFILSRTHLISYPVLPGVLQPLLAARVELIRQLNGSVNQLLNCVETADTQVLSVAVIAAKNAIAT
jgi:hypothetical protein